jgi:DNA-binding beta-propeller fold protein YncE
MLYRIDPATNEVAAAIPVDAAPTWETGGGGIAAGDGSIWVTGSGQGPGAVLQRIDPGTNEVVGTYFLGGQFGADVVVDETGVWVLMFDTDTSTEVVRLDPATADTVATIRLEAEWAHRIFSDAGAIWVNGGVFRNSTFDHSVLVKIDPGTNTVVATLPNAWFEAFDPVTQTIWTTASVAGRAGLARIDPKTVQFIGDPVPAARAIRGMDLLAADSGGVWFEGYNDGVDGDSGSIEHYNSGTNDIDASLSTPKDGPLQMALSPGSLWSVNYDGTVTRIDLA